MLSVPAREAQLVFGHWAVPPSKTAGRTAPAPREGNLNSLVGCQSPGSSSRHRVRKCLLRVEYVREKKKASGIRLQVRPETAGNDKRYIDPGATAAFFAAVRRALQKSERFLGFRGDLLLSCSPGARLQTTQPWHPGTRFLLIPSSLKPQASSLKPAVPRSDCAATGMTLIFDN